MEKLIFGIEKFCEISSEYLDSIIFLIIILIIELALRGIVFKIDKEKNKKNKIKNAYSLLNSEYVEQSILRDSEIDLSDYLKRVMMRAREIDEKSAADLDKISPQMREKILAKLEKENQKIYSFIEEKKKEEKNLDKALYLDRKKNSIVEDIYKKKMDQYNKASSLIFGGIVLNYTFNVFFAANIKIEVQILLYVLFGLMFISRLLISYRIKKGYYGTNYVESKEILYYMTANRDKNIKNTGKKIFNDIDTYNKVSEQIPEDGELQY